MMCRAPLTGTPSNGIGMIGNVVKFSINSLLGLDDSLECAAASETLGCLLGINHPRHAELIDAHPETGGPEGLLKRHLYLPVCRQLIKYAFRLSPILDLDRYREACRFFVMTRGSVRTHQDLIA